MLVAVVCDKRPEVCCNANYKHGTPDGVHPSQVLRYKLKELNQASHLTSLRAFFRRDDGNAASKQSRIHRIGAWAEERQRRPVEYQEDIHQVGGVETDDQIREPGRTGDHR